MFSDWHPDDTSPAKWLSSPAHPHLRRDANSPHSLRRFDFSSVGGLALALKYRESEVPFMIYNIPELDEASDTVFPIPSLLEKFGSDLLTME